MNRVICYLENSRPSVFDSNSIYFQLFSNSNCSSDNISYVGNRLFAELRKSKIRPPLEAIDFIIIALSVVAADKAVLRKNSADGWTRELELEIPVSNVDRWRNVKTELEWILRFLSGDFWHLEFKQMTDFSFYPIYDHLLRNNDCVCLLSGGMDSLIGAIDLCESGLSPLLVSQRVRGDAMHQIQYAEALGNDNLCQWSCYVRKVGPSENSTRARSIIFYAYALAASYALKLPEDVRSKIFVPENGFISLNISLDPLRLGTLSTKTTHPVFIDALQNIWNKVGFTVDLVLPYQYKTKGEMLLECKNQDLMKSLIMSTTSCGKYARHSYRHCGLCVPCLVRRASFKKAGMTDVTENGYCKDCLVDSTSLDVGAVSLAIAQSKASGIESVIQGSLSFADNTARDKYKGVLERGLLEISDFLFEEKPM